MSPQRKEAAEKVEIRHYLCDHLGMPNALIREDSRLDWAVQLDAWGNVRAEHNPDDLYQPIRLKGQQQDAISNFIYNRHRYYDFHNASYINQDPIGIFGGINQYNFSMNKPIERSDPLGLFDLPSLPRADESNFLGYMWNLTIDGELLTAGIDCESTFGENFLKNHKQTNRLANDGIDEYLKFVPDFLVSITTPAVLTNGGAAAKSYNGSTILQTISKVISEGKPGRNGVMPIRSAPLGMAGTTLSTTAINAVAANIAWNGGLALGSGIKAAATSMSCRCKK